MKTALLTILALTIMPFTAHAETNVTTVKVRDNIHMLVSPNGGNVTAFHGEDGTFIIDDNLGGREQIIEDAIKAATQQDVNFILNTHYHFDHTGTNEHFGAQDAIIVAHDNVRERLSSDQFISFFKKEMTALSKDGLPVVTFSNDMTLHYNGDEVKIIHLPSAHTDGDAIAHFTKANVIVAGDLIFYPMYPFIDAGTGGSLQGVLDGQDKILALADDKTVIIPGHGPQLDKAKLQAYRNALATLGERISAAVKDGKSKDDVIAMPVTEALETTLNEGPVNRNAFVGFLYDHLSK